LLLMSHDCARSDSFPFTFEFLSHIARATRAAVSSTIGDLHEAGLIYRRRGCIRIVDREELERRACRCCKISAGEYDRPAILGKTDTIPSHRVVSSTTLNHPHSRSPVLPV
jgi:hypothetical protein